MKRPITMPALSDTMNNGRLTRWLKQPGDAIKTGDAIAEVETDKAVMEVEAFHDGYLAAPLAAINSELPVGQTIGFIADTAQEAKEAAAAPPGPPPVAPVAPPATVAATAAAPPVAASLPAGPAARGLEVDSPRARARARHDAAGQAHAVSSSKPAPRAPDVSSPAEPIQDADIEAGPPFRIERPSSLREAVARNVSASAAIPTFHVTAQLSLEPLMKIATAGNLSLTVLLARVCAQAVAAHPLFNAAFTPAGLAHRDRIDIGVATDSVDGLITPVLRDVAGRSIDALSNDWKALVEKVKSRRLVPADYRGATFYLSNLGVFPVVHSFDSIVPAGASAILSVAASRPEGTFFTLNCDHRVVFGGDAARFLQTFGELLTHPTNLV